MSQKQNWEGDLKLLGYPCVDEEEGQGDTWARLRVCGSSMFLSSGWQVPSKIVDFAFHIATGNHSCIQPVRAGQPLCPKLDVRC